MISIKYVSIKSLYTSPQLATMSILITQVSTVDPGSYNILYCVSKVRWFRHLDKVIRVSYIITLTCSFKSYHNL